MNNIFVKLFAGFIFAYMGNVAYQSGAKAIIAYLILVGFVVWIIEHKD